MRSNTERRIDDGTGVELYRREEPAWLDRLDRLDAVIATPDMMRSTYEPHPAESGRLPFVSFTFGLAPLIREASQ